MELIGVKRYRKATEVRGLHTTGRAAMAPRRRCLLQRSRNPSLARACMICTCTRHLYHLRRDQREEMQSKRDKRRGHRDCESSEGTLPLRGPFRTRPVIPRASNPSRSSSDAEPSKECSGGRWGGRDRSERTGQTQGHTMVSYRTLSRYVFLLFAFSLVSSALKPGLVCVRRASFPGQG